MQHHAQELPHADFSLSSPDYFSTMGIPRLRGRDFTDADRYGSNPVVIISEALARQSFPNEDPIGRRLQCGLDAETHAMDDDRRRGRQCPAGFTGVPGIAGDVHAPGAASVPRQRSAGRDSNRGRSFFPDRVGEAHRRADEPPGRDEVHDDGRDGRSSRSPTRASVRHSALSFAALALLLAIMGVYAVMNYVTVQRTSEFAIRAALGAPRGAILRLVLRGAARLAAAGVVAGAATRDCGQPSAGELAVRIEEHGHPDLRDRRRCRGAGRPAGRPASGAASVARRSTGGVTRRVVCWQPAPNADRLDCRAMRTSS